MKHKMLAFGCEHAYRSMKNHLFLKELYQKKSGERDNFLNVELYEKNNESDDFWQKYFEEKKSELEEYKAKIINDLNKRMTAIQKFNGFNNIDTDKIWKLQQLSSLFGQFVFVQQEFNELKETFGKIKADNPIGMAYQEANRYFLNSCVDGENYNSKIICDFYQSMRNALAHRFDMSEDYVEIEFKRQEYMKGNNDIDNECIKISNEIRIKYYELDEYEKGKYRIRFRMDAERFKNECKEYVENYRLNFSDFIIIDLNAISNNKSQENASEDRKKVIDNYYESLEEALKDKKQIGPLYFYIKGKNRSEFAKDFQNNLIEPLGLGEYIYVYCKD